MDSFTPREKNDGVVCSNQFELLRASRYRLRDAFQALAYLREDRRVDADNIFLVGQSNGGRVAIQAAGGPPQESGDIETGFRAVVALYPWCGEFPPSLKSPLLVLGAELDDWVSPAGCVRRLNRIGGATYQVHVYAGAYHSFDLDVPVSEYAGRTIGGNADAKADSRARMLNFFNQARKH